MQVQLLLTVREDIGDFQKGLLMGTAGKGVVGRGQLIFLNLSQSQIVIDPVVDPGSDSLPPGDLRPLDEEAQSLPPDQIQENQSLKWLRSALRVPSEIPSLSVK